MTRARYLLEQLDAMQERGVARKVGRVAGHVVAADLGLRAGSLAAHAFDKGPRATAKLLSDSPAGHAVRGAAKHVAKFVTGT